MLVFNSTSFQIAHISLNHLHHHFRKHRLAADDISHLVDVTHLPEEHEELLEHLHLLTGARQVRLDEGVVQQPCDALQDELEVLEEESVEGDVHLPVNVMFARAWCFIR